jgi:hypothetical protein
VERIRLTFIVACGKSLLWQVLVKPVDDNREKILLKCHSNGLADGIFFDLERNAIFGNIILQALGQTIFLNPLVHIDRRDGKPPDDDLFSGQGLEVIYDIKGDIKDVFDSHEGSFDEETTILHFAKGGRPRYGSNYLMTCEDEGR